MHISLLIEWICINEVIYLTQKILQMFNSEKYRERKMKRSGKTSSEIDHEKISWSNKDPFWGDLVPVEEGLREFKKLDCNQSTENNRIWKKFQFFKTRNEMIFWWSGWRLFKTNWRTEPIVVAKTSDELPKGVKSESNLKLSGSHRNILSIA